MRKGAPVKKPVRGDARVTTAHRLLTTAWTEDVKSVEIAISRCTVDRALDHECEVVLFEEPGDAQLHVNVTHQRLTNAASLRAGPRRSADGYVHNRRFSDRSRSQIVRQILDMIFGGGPGSRPLAGIVD